MAADCVRREWIDICSNPNLDALLAARKIGFRNGNWRRLSLADRGLFRCALWVAKVQGRIASLKLLVRLLGIVLRLLERPVMRISRAGRSRADELMQRFEERKIFRWAPSVRSWLDEKDYVFYLGLNELF